MIPKGGIPGSIRSVLVTETAVSLNQLGGNYARVQRSVYKACIVPSERRRPDAENLLVSF